MSTIYASTAIRLYFDGTGSVSSYNDTDLFLTWEGSETSFRYTLTGESIRGLPQIAFDTALHSAKGSSILANPSDDNSALAADISWNDGADKSATVLIAAEDTNARLIIAAIEGDALPTAADDLAAWFASLTIAEPTGSFGAGSTFTTADLGHFAYRSGSLYMGTDGDDAPINGGDGYDYFVPTPGTDSFDGGDTVYSDTIHANRMILSADPNLNINLKRGLITWDEGRVTLTNVDGMAATDYDDILNGNDNNNSITGNGGADIIRGYGGNDNVNAGSGDDVVWAGDGDDYVRGGNDADILRGQAGEDHLEGEDGADIIRAGADNDEIWGDDDSGETGDDGADRLFGNGGDDTIWGGGADDHIEGGRGADTLYGGSGDDALRGDAGQDVLEGGTGSDNYYGGDNADSFVFTDIDGMGRDKIKDFEDGLDTIDISDFGWDEATLLSNLSQQGTNVRLEFGIHAEGTDLRLVLIENMDLADITAADFTGLVVA